MKNDNTLEEFKPRKWLQVLLIIIALAIVVVLADKAIKVIKSQADEQKNNITSVSKTAFNSKFEVMSGSQSGFFLDDLIDTIIINNKKNSEHLVAVKFDTLNTTDPNEIKEMKKSISDDNEYEVSLDYDENGYVNLITIELTKDASVKTVDPKDFNFMIENLAGTKPGTAVGMALDEIIQSNNNNKDHLIYVVYGSTNTADVTAIKDLKKQFDTWSDYEVSVAYDDAGYINKLIIENV